MWLGGTMKTQMALNWSLRCEKWARELNDEEIEEEREIKFNRF
jgi:hypothetical protein